MISSLLLSKYSTSGSNSSLDIYTKANQALLAQNKPLNKINATLSTDKTTVSGLGQLRSALAALQNIAQALTGSGLNTAASAVPSDILNATTSSAAVAGSHDIVVAQLAQSQVLVSHAIASPDTAIGSGATTTLKFEFGTSNGTQFTPTTNAAARTITLGKTDNTLSGIAAAVNAANIGVNAQVIHGTAGYSIAFSSPSGAANSLRISVNGDNTLQNVLSYNPAGNKALTQTSTAQNAALTIDGTALTSASNTVTKALAGVSLNLTATGRTQLVVEENNAQIEKNITNLVGAYNALRSKLTTLQQGDLKGDKAVANALQQIAQVFQSSGGTALGDLGITNNNGQLVVDSQKLHAAVAADPATVAKRFTGNGSGVTDSLVNTIKTLIGANGDIQKRNSALTKDITYLTTQKTALSNSIQAYQQTPIKAPTLFDYI